MQLVVFEMAFGYSLVFSKVLCEAMNNLYISS